MGSPKCYIAAWNAWHELKARIKSCVNEPSYITHRGLVEELYLAMQELEKKHGFVVNKESTDE